MSVWKYIRQQWRLNLLVLILDIFGASFVTIFSLGIADIMTELVARDLQAVLHWFVVLLVICVLWGAQIFLHDRVFMMAEQRMDTDIRHDISLLLEGTKYAFFHKSNSSIYVSWLTNDISTINDYGFDCLELAITQALMVVMSAAAILKFHYSLMIATVLLLILMYVVPKLFTQRMSKNALASTQANEKATKIMADFLAGFGDLLMLNTPYLLHQAVKKSSNKISNAKIKQATVSGAMHGASNFTSFLSQVLIMAQSCVLFIRGVAPIGAMSAARDFSSIIFSSTTGFFENLMEVRTTKAIFEKYLELANEQEDTFEHNHLPQLANSLDFDHISFQYDKNEILADCSFSIKAAHKYILVGDSGSGKSTIFNLIAKKLTPNSGQVSYDQVSYHAISPFAIRDQLVYINQQPHIFNETLRFNIGLQPDVSDADLAQAVSASGLQPFVESLPAGLDTVIEENGLNISGGQIQRIAIARGLVQKKQLWLIDEATSSLDPQSVTDIENRLLALPKVTMIMISHHITDNLRNAVDGELRLVNKQVRMSDS